MDRLGASKLRQVDLNSCLTPESCSLSPGQSMSDILARWITDEPFSQATLSGPYTVHLAILACPNGSPCLEAVDATLRITVAVPQNYTLVRRQVVVSECLSRLQNPCIATGSVQELYRRNRCPELPHQLALHLYPARPIGPRPTSVSL